MSRPIPIIEQFSTGQKEHIIQLFYKGKTQKDIGIIFGVPRRTIMKLFKHLNLNRNHSQAQKGIEDRNPVLVERVKELRLKGKSIPNIVSIINSEGNTVTSQSAVGRICKKFNLDNARYQYINNIDYYVMARDYDTGMTLKQLAKKYNVSTATLSNRLAEIGVKMRPPLFSSPNYIKKQRKIDEIDLPAFMDSKEWFEKAYGLGYSTPEIAIFISEKIGVKRSPGYVTSKLSKYGIQLRSISQSIRSFNHEDILSSYKELGSASKVAGKIGCSTQNVLNVLRKNSITPITASDMFSGDGNPFFGKTHSDETRELCKKIGSYFGKKFWVDHPEYIEVVREKNKLIWSDLEKRSEQSKRISLLRKQGKCNSYKGVVDSRFGQLAFDSSYELSLIEFLEDSQNVVSIERDFDLVEYEYRGFTHYFVPDFRIWLSNGDFIIVEVKSKWLQLKPKEHEKIYSAFEKFYDKFMVVDKDFVEITRRISLSLNPVDFSFNEIGLRDVKVDDYVRFYATFHYMGRTGRRGPTVGAYLDNKLIACCTISSITRNQMAEKQGVSPGEIRELVRMCIHPDFHKKNFASWLLSKVIIGYKKSHPNVKILISFADTTHNHDGIIYKASNWIYDGDTKPSYHYVDKNGQEFHKKTVWNRAKKENMIESKYVIKHDLYKKTHKPKKRFILRLS